MYTLIKFKIKSVPAVKTKQFMSLIWQMSLINQLKVQKLVPECNTRKSSKSLSRQPDCTLLSPTINWDNKFSRTSELHDMREKERDMDLQTVSDQFLQHGRKAQVAKTKNNQTNKQKKNREKELFLLISLSVWSDWIQDPRIDFCSYRCCWKENKHI